MSECVVRMEMPENCFECPFSIIDDTADGAWCNALANQVYGYAERDKDCPIICSLPEGHGRLIDADALHKIAWPVKDHTGRIEECVQMRDLYKAPTIAPAEPPKEGE